VTIQVLVIAKEPVPGRVKTRLCPPCTPEQAAEVAAAALADTMNTVRSIEVSRRVLVFDGRPPEDVQGFEVIGQRGDGLAERLANAFEDAGAPALLIGMDCPQMSPGTLAAAIAALERPRIDAVLGATADGGYWAIGLKSADRAVFANVPMSTPYTFAAQLERLQALGLRVGLLPVLQDVDSYADARAVASQSPKSKFGEAVARLERESVIA
jgi:rSAM/selenodomain-associated transferase 1